MAAIKKLEDYDKGVANAKTIISPATKQREERPVLTCRSNTYYKKGTENENDEYYEYYEYYE